MLSNLIIILHVVMCLALILIILLQTGKGAGMGAAFGGSSQTLFGSTGRATFLTKVTIAAAIIFGLTSLSLSLIKTESGVMEGYEQPAPKGPELPGEQPVPEVPAADVNIPGEEEAPPEETPPAAPAQPAEQEDDGLPELPELPEGP